jgi:hypothetical protein
MSMYEDEPFALFVGQQSIPEIVEIHKNDSNPFTHALIMHFWFKLFGVSLVAGKLFSVLLSSITAGLIFQLFSKRFGFLFPLLASLLFTLSGINFFHAQEMRIYPLLILITVLSVHYFIELLFQPNWKNALKLAMSNFLLLMSHYTAFFLPLIELGILIFYIQTHKKSIKLFLISQFFAALLFAPWFFYAAINNMPTGKSWLQMPYLKDIPWFINRMATYPIALLNILLFIVISYLKLWKKKLVAGDYRLLLFFNAFFWGTIAGSFIISKKIPIMSDRYLLFATIGLFLAIGYSIHMLNIKPKTKGILSALIIIIGLSSITFRPIPENWPTKIEYIKKYRNNNELIFVYPWWSYRAFAFYHDKEAFEDYHLTTRRLSVDKVIPTNDIDFITEKIKHENSKTLYLVMYKGGKDEEIINRIKVLGYNVSYRKDKLKPTLVQFKK